jgi:hypothetical protein
MFYLRDSNEDSSKKILLQNISEHQQVFQISLSDGYFQHSTMKKHKHRIGVFDEKSNQVLIYELDEATEQSLDLSKNK